jgi:hypothetical protein
VNLLAIIERLKEYLANLKAKWYWIALSVLILTALMLLHGWSKPSFYTAQTTFHPESEKNVSGTDGANIPLFFSGINQNESEMTYMKGLLASRSLNRSLVADSVDFQGERVLVADLIEEYHPPYSSLFSYLDHVLFSEETNFKDLPLDRKILSASSMANRSMTLGTTSSGFAELRFSYYNSEVAGLICEQYLKQLKYYYSNQKSRKTQQTISFLQTRTDSIKRKLDSVNYALARSQDQGRFRLFARDEILPAELQSKQNILSQLYVSLYASQEQARAQQQRDVPVIQVIDPPMPPYPVTHANLILYAVLGIIGGLLMGIFLVSASMLWADARFLLQEYVIKPALAQDQPPTQKTESTRAPDDEGV